MTSQKKWFKARENTYLSFSQGNQIKEKAGAYR